jgi:hypothetical protein
MKDKLKDKAFFNQTLRIKGKTFLRCYFHNSNLKNDKHTVFIECYFYKCNFENSKINAAHNIIIPKFEVV